MALTKAPRTPSLPRVEALPDPPSLRTPPRRRRRLRTRGGGWLLAPSFVALRRPRPTPLPGPGGAGLRILERGFDLRSPLDLARWLRWRAEAGRWH
ncbi:hypothetical protein [Gaopeijia maritima]|uniref:Uncharacterized protein n=1 Tax=Gaopeijia maritima TaxID=3119007 RepID=A0ABU9EBN0_9BACT